MASFIIRKKDLDKIGKKLMKEVYQHVRDDYMLTFDEVKSERDYFDKNLVSKFLKFHEEKEKKYQDLYFSNKRYGEIVKMSHEELLKKIGDTIETIDLEIIYNVLKDLKLNPEIEEDLYYSKKAFISIYDVYYFHSSYLED